MNRSQSVDPTALSREIGIWKGRGREMICAENGKNKSMIDDSWSEYEALIRLVSSNGNSEWKMRDCDEKFLLRNSW